jgi:beta-galactosidase beta subunit
MKNLEKRLVQIEKELQSDQYSAIPKAERFLAISAYTKEEFETKKNERLAELHRKYVDFKEDSLFIVYVRQAGPQEMEKASQGKSRDAFSS